LFDEVYVAIMINPNKVPMFSIEERINIINDIYKKYDNVHVVYGTVTVDLASENDCSAILRGLRSLSDYEYEVSMAQVNKQISNGKINTICLFSDANYQFISSSIVKEIDKLGKDLSAYVHPIVEEKMILRRSK
jgi:pantetheine-phosphate adenylyltransferase